MTTVEGVTNFTVSAQGNSQSAKAVAKATIRLLNPYMSSMLSTTTDNGRELANHEKISKALSTEFYFTHLYGSWERGLNWNTNGLLRQYFPENTDFKNEN